LFTPSVTELVEPVVLEDEPVVPSEPVVPVVEVGVTTPPVEVTLLVLLDPEDWLEPLELVDSLVVPVEPLRVVPRVSVRLDPLLPLKPPLPTWLRVR
jgi:hypothetical protein